MKILIEITLVISGLVIGIIFGFALQRGRFCMNSAFRDIIVLKEYTLIKAVALAILVMMIGFHLLATTGSIQLNPKPLYWGAVIFGGFIFGIGMVLAAGCASGTTYRVGEGMMGSFVAAIGLTAGALWTASGILDTVKDTLQSVTLGTKLTLFGELSALTPWFMLIVGIIGIVLMLVFWSMPTIKRKLKAKEPLIKFENFKESTFKKGYPWWVTGILIGLILTAGYIVSGGVVGITGGWMDISNWFTSADSVMWAGFIIIGLIFGSFISALISGEFKFRVPKEGFTIVKQFLGGLLMGFGAVTAMGCNITNILGGVPQLSIHSIITGACIMFGAWIAAFFLFSMWKKDK